MDMIKVLKPYLGRYVTLFFDMQYKPIVKLDNFIQRSLIKKTIDKFTKISRL